MTPKGKEVDEVNPAIEVICQLIKFLEDVKDNIKTSVEFDQKIKQRIEELKRRHEVVPAEVSCVTEIFLRYISLKFASFDKLDDALDDLRNRGEIFLKNVSQAKLKVAKTGSTYISDGSTVMVHSASKVVFLTLKEAFRNNKRFTVIVTESNSSGSGHDMKRWLDHEGIRNKLISDSAIGYFMETTDIVMVGAEAVVKNGGIVNQSGSYLLAIAASIAHKPMYVMVESYKFSQIYPMRQRDVQLLLRRKSSLDIDRDDFHPDVDYTPPQFVTLLITDLGPLPTAAVSDVLMQLYV